MENQTTEKNVVEEAIEKAKEEAGLNEAEETTDTVEETEEVETAEGVVEDKENSDEEDSDDKSDKKGFFKKKKDKKDEIIEELTDKNKRMLAEFENFRNRSEKEKSAMFEVGAKTVIEKILPVIDNFERGLTQKPEGAEAEGFVTGMDMVYKQLLSSLDELGVKPIEAVGKEFDPELHNAVMHVEDEEAGENVVVEEFQKGYMYKDTVVRHSMVKVAN